MSAFVVGKAHIDAIIHAGIVHAPNRDVSWDTVDTSGMDWQEAGRHRARLDYMTAIRYRLRHWRTVRQARRYEAATITALFQEVYGP